MKKNPERNAAMGVPIFIGVLILVTFVGCSLDPEEKKEDPPPSLAGSYEGDLRLFGANGQGEDDDYFSFSLDLSQEGQKVAGRMLVDIDGESGDKTDDVVVEAVLSGEGLNLSLEGSGLYRYFLRQIKYVGSASVFGGNLRIACARYNEEGVSQDTGAFWMVRTGDYSLPIQLSLPPGTDQTAWQDLFCNTSLMFSLSEDPVENGIGRAKNIHWSSGDGTSRSLTIEKIPQGTFWISAFVSMDGDYQPTPGDYFGLHGIPRDQVAALYQSWLAGGDGLDTSLLPGIEIPYNGDPITIEMALLPSP